MKKIILVIIMLLGILIPIKTYALEDSFRIGEYIPGAYIIKLKNGSGKYEQMRVFRRNSDNRITYCIELWEGISEYKNLMGYESGQSNHANIPEWKWQQLVLVAYYGYGYPGHDSLNWYAATQFMLWDIIEDNSEIYFTDTLNGNRVDKYTDEINEITNLVNKHSKTPNFSNMTALYNQEYSLNDSNEVLNKFKVANVYGLTSKVENNTLKFKVTKEGQTLLRFYKDGELYSNKPTVYIDSSGQNLLLPGSYPAIKRDVFITVNKTNLTINKVDSETNNSLPRGEANLDGVEFSLYDKDHEYVNSGKTDSNGKLVFNNLYEGIYYLKETKTGTGYTLDDSERRIFVSTSNNTFTIGNDIIKSKVKINKYLKDSNGNLVKEEASFIILDKDNNEYLSFSTNSDGYYEFYLPYGIYKLKQAKGTKNYKYIDDREINVDDGSDIELNLYNEELVVPIEITNVDSESNLPILDSGATFSIIDSDNKEIKLTTNTEGKTITVKLPAGIYTIKQIKSVDGYQINNNEYKLEINEDNFSYDNDVYNIDIPNTKEKAKVEVSKLIKYYLDDKLINTEKDENIKIDIYASNDIYSKDGILNYRKGEKVEEKELPYGNYYVNNPIKKEIIAINLDTPSTRQIEILDEIYNYTKVIKDVPNTYVKESVNYIYLILLASGLIIYRGKYEIK